MISEILNYDCRPFDPCVLFTRTVANVSVRILFGNEFQSMDNQLRNVIDGSRSFVENFDPAFDMAPLLRFLPESLLSKEN